jgi:hypothetical protein
MVEGLSGRCEVGEGGRAVHRRAAAARLGC